ncbi:MFS transporter [Peristeroidobacter soli]|uniref:MFS transporter n=1 Tax=Peristeroidobacter soli TaxID=2497877 RepID=UPI00101C74AC|nr:MFS transporter [Peristeroidobacter soli]
MTSVDSTSSSRWLLSSLAVMMLSIAGHANVTLKPLIISTYVSFLDITRSSAGFIVGIEAAATALTIALVVSVLDRVGRRRTLIVAALLIVMGNSLSALAHSVYEIAATRIIAGIGHGAAQAVCAAAIATFLGAERVSALVAVTVAIAGMGLMFLIPWLQGLLGPAPLFLAMAALVALPMALMSWMPLQPAEGVQQVGAVGETGKRRVLIAVSLTAAAFFYLSVGSFWPYAAEFGKLAGLTYQKASGAAAVAHLAAVVGAGVVMLFSKHIAKSVGVAAAILGAIAALALLLSRSEDPGTFMLACVGFMFCWGVFYPLFMGFLSELDRSGRANGYFFTIAMVAFAVGPTFGGAVIGLGAQRDGELTNLLWMSLLCQVPALAVVFAMTAHNRHTRSAAHESQEVASKCSA